MKYKEFKIIGYKGLERNTTINISNSTLHPIIGKNESGKTTFLEAIFAFDFLNDDENEGRHLKNIDNLYTTLDSDCVVEAKIEIDTEFDFKELIEEQYNQMLFVDENGEPIRKEIDEININDYLNSPQGPFLKAYQLLIDHHSKSRDLVISRDIKSKLYEIPILNEVIDKQTINFIGKEIIKKLPYSLYFDDFRDRIPDKLYLIREEDNALYSPWIKYFGELFVSTNENYSIFDLSKKSDSKRRSIIKEVEKRLNVKLIEEWSKYQFETSNSIKVIIEYSDGSEIPYLHFKIVETVKIGDETEDRFFDISDRSKGFYWYFNFMIKLNYNPSKRESTDKDTIYLLDEPGSYLHTFALNKLAEQLRNISQSNIVIYCTHSHNLLNPNVIPINSIKLAEKSRDGIIQLKNLNNKGIIRPSRNSAYQSVLDALEVRPPLFEYEYDNVILMEGIYDYYSFRMFTDKSLSYFPCVSASSIVNQIPYMIFLEKKYLAVWDNDSEGRGRLKKAQELFGEIEASKFITLKEINGNSTTRVEEYFETSELDKYNSEVNNQNLSFEKSILSLFYSIERDLLIEKYFQITKANFHKMENYFFEKLLQQN